MNNHKKGRSSDRYKYLFTRSGHYLFVTPVLVNFIYLKKQTFLSPNLFLNYVLKLALEEVHINVHTYIYAHKSWLYIKIRKREPCDMFNQSNINHLLVDNNLCKFIITWNNIFPSYVYAYISGCIILYRDFWIQIKLQIEHFLSLFTNQNAANSLHYRYLYTVVVPCTH